MAPTGRATPRLSSLPLSRHNGHGRACRRPTRLGRALLGGTLPVRFPLRHMTTIIQLRAPSNPPSVAASMPAARVALMRPAGEHRPRPAWSSARPLPICRQPAVAAPLAHYVPEARKGKMVATDQRLVGCCAVEEGHARLSCQWHVQVEPERPFRMQEADLRVGYDVAGEEHLFAAGTDMHRHVTWRVTGGVEGGHARRRLRSGFD